MATTKWVLDPMHSELQFKVKHLMITTVTGSFNEFSAELTTDSEDFEHAAISFKAGVDSIDTGNKDRDGHLKSGDFFNAEEFPAVSFESTSFKKAKGDVYNLIGNLTLKGVTKEVELEAEYGGTEKDQYGNIKVGFEVTGTVNRKDFGVSFNSLTETGGLALGENIKIIANIQIAKQA